MTNWERSRTFYVDGLGHIDWEHQFEPDFPVFTQLTRDGLSFFLTEHTGDCPVGGGAYFVVDDVDALYREISARGIRPAELPEDTPWHTREMTILDPDGNRLRFATAGAG
jgi:catechol 2,3-dioxygenase-like lactoylglutathione lyase family enzyme